MSRTLIILSVLGVCMAQRSPYAGKRPIGYPELDTTTTTTTTADPLGNKFGEGSTSTTERLPIEAGGDRNFLEAISKLPVDKQPFWYLNWKAIEEHRNKPQTYVPRPNPFLADGNIARPGNNVNTGVQPSPQNGNPGQQIPQNNVPVSSLPTQQVQNPNTGFVQQNPQNNFAQPNQGPQNPNFQTIFGNPPGTPVQNDNFQAQNSQGLQDPNFQSIFGNPPGTPVQNENFQAQNPQGNFANQPQTNFNPTDTQLKFGTPAQGNFQQNPLNNGNQPPNGNFQNAPQNLQNGFGGIRSPNWQDPQNFRNPGQNFQQNLPTNFANSRPNFPQNSQGDFGQNSQQFPQNNFNYPAQAFPQGNFGNSGQRYPQDPQGNFGNGAQNFAQNPNFGSPANSNFQQPSQFPQRQDNFGQQEYFTNPEPNFGNFQNQGNFGYPQGNFAPQNAQPNFGFPNFQAQSNPQPNQFQVVPDRRFAEVDDKPNNDDEHVVYKDAAGHLIDFSGENAF